MPNGQELAGLLTIWPIAETFALYTPVGDLISLARTNSALRASLHGRVPVLVKPEQSTELLRSNFLDPEVGRHQTRDWIRLKNIAPFTCSSTKHIRGQKLKPCVSCSKPICDACIVRDAFSHPNESTFKNRLRYFCRHCWAEGRPSQSFRYPALNTLDDSALSSEYATVNEVERPNSTSSTFCDCSAIENGFLCIPCKEVQNSSELAPSKFLSDLGSHVRTVQCHGLGCGNLIELDNPEKDRCRVCLWCQKPLRRQYGGEDRFAWNQKTIDARTRNAENRRTENEEYNRWWNKAMRMSRSEMRGTSQPGDEEPSFVRHLDAVNYRNWMTDGSAPDPQTVWNSKNGYWRYHRGFLFAVQMRCKRASFGQINGVDVQRLSEETNAGTSAFSRLNRELYPHYLGPGVPKIDKQTVTGRKTKCLNELKARILNMYYEGEQDGRLCTDTSEYLSSDTIQTNSPAAKINEIIQTLKDQYDLETEYSEMALVITQWLQGSRSQSPLGEPGYRRGEEHDITTMTNAPVVLEELPSQNSSLAQLSEPLPDSEDLEGTQENPRQSTIAVTTDVEGRDDPPPYAP